MFTTSDIGWVVGHSYIIYAPLINGSTTIMYEGLPIRPDPAIWWKIVADYKVTTMFSSPTAIRVLKKQDPAFMKKHDLSSLQVPVPRRRAARRADARAGPPTRSASPIVDNYWQTETGWPILSAQPGVEETPRKFGSPSFPVYGYDVRLLHEGTGEEAGADEKGVLTIVPPLPPGLHDDGLGRRRALRARRISRRSRAKLAYSTFDWAMRDADGYYFVLGRTDDVINVAGHRLGTREIEEAVQAHPGIAEVAVVGVADPLKGQMPVAFAVVKDPARGRHARGRRGDAQGSDGHGRPRARRDRAAGRRAFRDAAAEDALRQAAAPLDPGAGRGPRSRATSRRSRIRPRWSRSAPRWRGA